MKSMLRMPEILLQASVMERIGRVRLLWGWFAVAFTSFFDSITGPLIRRNWGPVPLSDGMQALLSDDLISGLGDYAFAYLRPGLIAFLVWYVVRLDWRGMLQASVALAGWYSAGPIFMTVMFPPQPD